MGARLPASVLLAAALAGCAGGSRPTVPSPTPTAAPTRSNSATATPTSSPSAVPTTTSPAPSASSSPSYPWSARRATAAELSHSWRPGCPVPPSRLRVLTLRYVGFDGRRHTGHLVVAASAVSDVVQVFRRLDAARFPIRSLRPVDDFGGSDDASMAADNTSAFNCRLAVGGSGLSQHAYGLAVDVNPRENPYVVDGKVLPPEGAAYTDRRRVRPGMAVTGGVLVRAFEAVGWGWGGRWKSSKDYQHFSATGR